jgi:L-ascorbate metabolism protein UlaG (beta-lactamase superfamily)
MTKYTHACVRFEGDGGVLVVDPGGWSEPQALAGADAVLITHEHADHFDELRLLGAGLPVFAPNGANLGRVEATRLEPDQELEIAGFRVRTVGGRHAETYGGKPDVPNLGYLIDDAVYVPGDALARPGRPVETLFVPAAAPWLKTAEAIEFVAAIRPRRAFAIHDGMLSDRGLPSLAIIGRETGIDYRRLTPPETVEA